MYLFVEYKNNIEFLLENNTLNIVVFTKRQETNQKFNKNLQEKNLAKTTINLPKTYPGGRGT